MIKRILALTVLSSLAVASQASFLVYNNIPVPPAALTASAATSSADLLQTWGDQVTLTNAGKLDTFSYGVFNSTTGGNTGALLTATVNIRFYDLGVTPYTSGAITARPLIGNFNSTVNFGATGLAAGFFQVINHVNLASLNINLTSNIMITQQVTTFTGTTNRLGIVTMANESVGSSFGGDSWYRKTGATEGLTFFNPPATNKMAYAVGIVPEPATMAAMGIGLAGLIARRRRRNS